jgi:hypothetical protein
MCLKPDHPADLALTYEMAPLGVRLTAAIAPPYEARDASRL